MPKLKEIIVEAALPALKAVGKAEMEVALLGIKKNNTPEIYKTTLQGLYSNFSLLKEVTLKTRSRIDDGIVELVLQAVQESAEVEGIVLS